MLLAQSFATWAAFASILLFRIQEIFVIRRRCRRTDTSPQQTFLELSVESLKLRRKFFSCFLRRIDHVKRRGCCLLLHIAASHKGVESCSEVMHTIDDPGGNSV